MHTVSFLSYSLFLVHEFMKRLIIQIQVFKKLSLGAYRWISYNEAHLISKEFGRGLRELGQQPRSPIAIYAETTAEWIISAFGIIEEIKFLLLSLKAHLLFIQGNVNKTD